MTTEYALGEPIKRRGKTLSAVYGFRALGHFLSSIFNGFGMNSYAYNGSFPDGLSFRTMCMVYAAMVACVIPVLYFYVHEKKRGPNEKHTSFKEYRTTVFKMCAMSQSQDIPPTHIRQCTRTRTRA